MGLSPSVRTIFDAGDHDCDGTLDFNVRAPPQTNERPRKPPCRAAERGRARSPGVRHSLAFSGLPDQRKTATALSAIL